MINRQLVKSMRKDIDAELKKLGARYNVVLSAGGCSFTSETATFKLNVSSIATDGSVVSEEVERFRNKRFEHGLPADLLGKIVGKNVFTGMGQGYKYAFLYKDLQTKKSYKCNKARLISLFEINSADTNFKPIITEI